MHLSNQLAYVAWTLDGRLKLTVKRIERLVTFRRRPLRYTSDWALETMAGAFEGCERLTRQLYTQFYEEGYRCGHD